MELKAKVIQDDFLGRKLSTICSTSLSRLFGRGFIFFVFFDLLLPPF